MIDGIVFITRQSPDWRSLSRDYRDGRAIDANRFVPAQVIPGFPPSIEALIAAWNQRFAIDFFTVRSAIASLSERCIAAVPRSMSFRLTELAAVAELAARQRFIAFFHDDDDFFAPDMAARLQATDAIEFDTCVFPLFRVHADLFTFVPDAIVPNTMLGRAKACDFRFQSNNYGINSHLCTTPVLQRMKDHVLASAFADAAHYTGRAFPFAISATVKTPASASQLPDLFSGEPALRAQFEGFIAQCLAIRLAAPDRWLQAPLQAIARLLQALLAGAGYSAIDDLFAQCG